MIVFYLLNLILERIETTIPWRIAFFLFWERNNHERWGSKPWNFHNFFQWLMIVQWGQHRLQLDDLNPHEVRYEIRTFGG